MGRKSSAKQQTRATAAPVGDAAPPAARQGWSRRLVIAAVALVAAVVGLIAYTRTSGLDLSRAAPTQSTPAAPLSGQTAAAPPAAARLSPHPQANLPPLPLSPTPPARPVDVVRAAYKFAAEHPEVLSYAPCYCGCERSGHRGNEDCFVTARDEKGDVTEWEPHGMT